MDKLLIFGRVYSFYSPKKNCNFYKIDYLSETGESCSDFINAESFMRINAKNIPLGTLVNARLELNQYNRGEIVDCIIDQ